MKISSIILTVLCLVIHPLLATPDHAVSVTERFLGSNATGFAVLRVETDNLGSYYSSRITTWLDEFPKTADGREKVKSTLLLDVSRVVDLDHTDRNTPPPVAEKINRQDATLTLASVLLTYPGQMRQSWTHEQMAKLEVHPVGGVTFKRKVFLVHGTFVHEKLFGGRHGDEPWSLSEVSEDAECIYLRLSIGNDSGPESRIVCVPAEITKRQRDQALAQPVYLVAGKFESREEAAQAAQAIMAKARELKLPGFELEIWSLEDGTAKTKYVIADPSSTYRIGIGGIPKLEAALEIRLTPLSSGRFIERFFVTN